MQEDEKIMLKPIQNAEGVGKKPPRTSFCPVTSTNVCDLAP